MYMNLKDILACVYCPAQKSLPGGPLSAWGSLGLHSWGGGRYAEVSPLLMDGSGMFSFR